MTSSCPPRAGEIGPIRREIVFEPLPDHAAPVELPLPPAPAPEPEKPVPTPA
jgi:hypothetical protein